MCVCVCVCVYIYICVCVCVCKKYACLVIKRRWVTSLVMSFSWVSGEFRVFQHSTQLASWTPIGLITPGPSLKK